LKNLVVKGAKGVTVDLNSAGANPTYTNHVTTLLSVDASGMTAQPTGTNTFTLKDTTGGHAMANGLTITGSGGDDIFSLGGTTGTNTLASGVIATINAGAGDDAVTVTAGQLYTSGSGYLAVRGDANGIAGDTLTISDSTAGTLSDNLWANVSGIENLAFTNTGALNLTGGSYFNSAFANGVTITDGATTSNAVTIDLTTFAGKAKITNVGTTGVQKITGGSGADTITVTSAVASTNTTGGTVLVSGGAGNDTISVTDASTFGIDNAIVITGGTGADKITFTGTNASNAKTVVKFVVGVGDSNVGSADKITGFYIAGSTRKVDNIDFAGTAIKPAAGFAAVAVTGNTLADLNVAVSTDGKITFSGTKAATLTAAQVESIWTTDISPRLNTLETALWANTNASDSEYNNTLVFNKNTLGDSEVILVGVAGTATGDAAATANLVGLT
jgi:S-layer protein